MTRMASDTESKMAAVMGWIAAAKFWVTPFSSSSLLLLTNGEGRGNGDGDGAESDKFERDVSIAKDRKLEKLSTDEDVGRTKNDAEQMGEESDEDEHVDMVEDDRGDEGTVFV